MSTRYGQKALPISNKILPSTFVNYSRNEPVYSGPVAPFRSTDSQYVRPAEYIPIDPPSDSEQLVKLLVLVSNDDSNFLSVSASGNYTVNWGDGVVENIGSTGVGGVASHLYIYGSTGLSGASGPTTSDGFKQALVQIYPQAGYNLGTINLNVRDTRATSTINAYSQPIEEAYISSPNLTSLTIGTGSQTLPYCRRMSYINLVNAGNITSFAIQFQNMFKLQRVDIGKTAAVTTTASMFQNCYSLKTVNVSSNANFNSLTNTSNMFFTCHSLVSAPLFDTRNVLDMSNMFQSCSNLTQVPLYNTVKVTNISNMFTGCVALTNVPLFNTAAVTNMQGMFNACASLTNIPAFDTRNVTSLQGAFQNCTSLKTIPLLNTIKAIDMASLFSGCSSLVSIPPLDTRAATNMLNMFASCFSLVNVPFLNTSIVTTMQNMFNSCYSLKTVPAFDTSNVVNMVSMFNTCYNLREVPAFNGAKVTSFVNMFLSCVSLIKAPAFTNTTLVTTATSMFNGCYSLTSVPTISLTALATTTSMFLNCNTLSSLGLTGVRAGFSLANAKLSKQELENIFTNLGSNGTGTITITDNWGALGAYIGIEGTTTAGSTTITNMTSVAGLTSGMQIVGNGTSITSGRAVSFGAGNTVSLNPVNNHGLQNNDEVAFSAVGGVMSVVTNTIYFVVNRTDTTFQVAAIAGGTPLTTISTSGQLKYNATIQSVGANSVTMSRPMGSSVTNSSLTIRPLQTYRALLKGFAISG